MNKAFFVALVTAGSLAAGTAHAQDKPVLNSAPPGAPPKPVLTSPPAPAAPTPAPTPAPAQPVPPAAPTPERPSGLDLPDSRDTRAAGGSTSGGLSSKLFIYSNFGLGYGSSNGYSQFNFSIAPALGYRFNDRFAAGPGISYAYNGYTFGNNGPSLSTSSVGIKAFAQVQVVDQFFIHGEYELTNAELLAVNGLGQLTGDKVRRQIATPLAGVGYRNQFSDRAAGDVLVLYNFADSFNSLYPNPVIRFSFLFNLGR